MKYEPYYDRCTHFRVALHPEELQKLLPSIVSILKPCLEEFEAVAFIGMSGALLAPQIALKLKKTLIMVRKTTRGVHSYRLVEGDKAAKGYIIVDDLVQTGDTAKKIMKRIRNWSGAKCLGVLEVNDVQDGICRRLTTV